MIALLRGSLLQKNVDSVVVDVHGVGYRLFVSQNTCARLPERGEEVCLHAHMVVREDAIQLYGFLTEVEREAFLSLMGVSGIGPKLARGILSGIRPDELASAVLEGKRITLQAIPGVGKRMAERILLELRGKVAGFQGGDTVVVMTETPAEDADSLIEKDVVSALMNLGYRRTEVSRAMGEARPSLKGTLGFQNWVKEALRLLAK
jgi:Holliday junction DNA helicase RuvA